MSITDDGFLRGDGAFEMLKLYEGRPFGMTDHLDRLDRSADGIFLEYDRSAFEREIDALIAEHGKHDAALRLVLTRGGRRIAIVEPLPAFRHGLRLSGVRYQPTIVLNQLKTLSYGGNMRATRLAQRDGADEALLDRARRHGARGAHLHPLLGRRAGQPAHARARDRRARIDHARADHAPRACDRGRELPPQRRARRAARCFLPRPCARCRASPRSTDSTSTVPGPVTQKVSDLLAEHIQAEITGAISSSG